MSTHTTHGKWSWFHPPLRILSPELLHRIRQVQFKRPDLCGTAWRFHEEQWGRLCVSVLPRTVVTMRFGYWGQIRYTVVDSNAGIVMAAPRTHQHLLGSLVWKGGISYGCVNCDIAALSEIIGTDNCLIAYAVMAVHGLGGRGFYSAGGELAMMYAKGEWHPETAVVELDRETVDTLGLPGHTILVFNSNGIAALPQCVRDKIRERKGPWAESEPGTCTTPTPSTPGYFSVDTKSPDDNSPSEGGNK